MEAAKVAEPKINNDRASEVEEKAKKDAEDMLKTLTGAADAAEAAKKKAAAGKDASGAGGAGDGKPPAGPTPDEIKRTKCKLSEEFSNVQAETSMSKGSDEYAELVRSKVPMVVVVDENDSNKWKLALVS